MSQHSDVWTEENTAALKSMWAEGLSAGLIVGKIPGTTRSSIMGKVRRLKLLGTRQTTAANRKDKVVPYHRPHNPALFTQPVGTWLTPTQLAKARSAARARGLKLAAYIRDLIEKDLACT